MSEDRAERLARQLRENLRRRKAQARARALEPKAAGETRAEADDDRPPSGEKRFSAD